MTHTGIPQVARRAEVVAPSPAAAGSELRETRSASRASARAGRRLAQGLRAAIADHDRPASPFLVRTSGSALADPDARAACIALAGALEAAAGVDPRLARRVEQLLTASDSPLLGTCGRRLAEDAGGLARALRF
jgi:hypothetical protein